MSQDSSIGQVWAANYGTNGKPAGVGEVWIANASAITGGGGGDIPAEVSGKWESTYDTVCAYSGAWGQGSYTGITKDASLTGDGTTDSPLGLESPISFQSNIASSTYGPNGASFNDGTNTLYIDPEGITANGQTLNASSISALENKKNFEVQEPLIVAEETVSSLVIGLDSASNFEEISAKKIVGVGGVTYNEVTAMGEPSGYMEYTVDMKWDNGNTFTGTFPESWDGYYSLILPLVSSYNDSDNTYGDLDIPDDTIMNIEVVDNTNGTTADVTGKVAMMPYSDDGHGPLIDDKTVQILNSDYQFTTGNSYSITVDTSSYGTINQAWDLKPLTATVTTSYEPVYNPSAESFVVASGIASAADFQTSNGVSLSSLTGAATNALTGIQTFTTAWEEDDFDKTLETTLYTTSTNYNWWGERMDIVVSSHYHDQNKYDEYNYTDETNSFSLLGTYEDLQNTKSTVEELQEFDRGIKRNPNIVPITGGDGYVTYYNSNSGVDWLEVTAGKDGADFSKEWDRFQVAFFDTVNSGYTNLYFTINTTAIPTGLSAYFGNYPDEFIGDFTLVSTDGDNSTWTITGMPNVSSYTGDAQKELCIYFPEEYQNDDGWYNYGNLSGTWYGPSAVMKEMAWKEDVQPIQIVADASQATGTNILYVVTGSI